MEQGEGLLALSQRDRDRLKELHGVMRGQQRLRDAAEHLGLSTKQARRLLERVAEEGDQGVIHRLRGQPSNRGIPKRVRAKALKRLSREEYHDFGPTLAAEHLERIDIQVSRETVRKWMKAAGLWKSRSRKVKAVHVWRERREAFGELVLVDTSEHDWLEGRGPKMYLVALIDDATSRLWARFVEGDTTAANLQTLRDWLELYGRPLALYTDKNTIFQTPRSAEQIDKDNTGGVEGMRFQIAKQAGRRTCAGLAVHIRRHLDGRYTIRRGTQLFGVYEPDGQPRLIAAPSSPRPAASKAAAQSIRPATGLSAATPSGGTKSRGRPRVPASGRLRLPAAGTRRSRAATKA
jgi:DNA-binding Lrp family transcriptional regulator